MRGKCKNSSNLYGVLDQGLNDYDIVRHSVFLMNSEKNADLESVLADHYIKFINLHLSVKIDHVQPQGIV